MLALFREVRAYPLIVRIFSRPGEFPFDLVSDVVTQDLGRIRAPVSGGDAGGMTTLFENEEANEWVRAVSLDAMRFLVDTGHLKREELVAYILKQFQNLQRKPGSHWDSMANVSADLWPKEMMDDLRRAYKEGLVRRSSIEWDDIEDALAMGKDAAMRSRRYRAPMIDNVGKAMGWMRCFHRENEHRDVRGPELGFINQFVDSRPNGSSLPTLRRSSPKVGRNDSCPCDSGKKFTKCCEPN